ncbi:unnamed protein product, partial [Symbiodinium sp. KB8]
RFFSMLVWVLVGCLQRQKSNLIDAGGWGVGIDRRISTGLQVCNEDDFTNFTGGYPFLGQRRAQSEVDAGTHVMCVLNETCNFTLDSMVGSLTEGFDSQTFLQLEKSGSCPGRTVPQSPVENSTMLAFDLRTPLAETVGETEMVVGNYSLCLSLNGTAGPFSMTVGKMSNDRLSHCGGCAGELGMDTGPTTLRDDDDGDDDIVIAITSNITINIVVVVCSNCVDTHGSWNVSSPTQVWILIGLRGKQTDLDEMKRSEDTGLPVFSLRHAEGCLPRCNDVSIALPWLPSLQCIYGELRPPRRAGTRASGFFLCLHGIFYHQALLPLELLFGVEHSGCPAATRAATLRRFVEQVAKSYHVGFRIQQVCPEGSTPDIAEVSCRDGVVQPVEGRDAQSCQLLVRNSFHFLGSLDMVRAMPIIMLLLVLPVSGMRNVEEASREVGQQHGNVGDVAEHRDHVKEGLSDTGHCHGETTTPEDSKTACTTNADCRYCGADWECYHMKPDTLKMKQKFYPDTKWLPAYCHHI